MKYRVLVSAPYFQPVLEEFRSEFERRGIEIVVPDVLERLNEAALLDVIGDIDGVLCGDDEFTERVLDRAKKLKVISKWGTGIDSIDRAACLARGIAVCNTPNAFSVPVADTVLGYTLAFSRNLLAMDRAMKGGVWKKIPGRALSECIFGIVGVGNIGTALAKRLQPFGAKLLGTDPRPISEDLKSSTGITQVSLEELLRQSDFVSLNCDLNPTSRHLIRAETLALMKPTAVLINTARGPIVKEVDLCTALESGRIAGAGLDVFEHEPLPVASPLRRLENALIAPHNSNSSPTAWKVVHLNTMRQLFERLEAHV